MFEPKIAAKIGLALALTACSPAVQPASTPSGDSSSPGADGNDPDPERSAANAPVQVNGSFLVDCANVGESGFGCAAQDSNHQKVAVDRMNVLVAYTDNTQATPTATAAPANSPWTIFFTIPADSIHKIASFQVGFSVGGVQQAVQKVDGATLAVKPLIAQVLLTTANVLFITSETYQPAATGMMDAVDMASNCQRMGNASTLIPNAGKLKWTPLLSVMPQSASDTVASIVNFVGSLTGPVINTAGRVVQQSSLFWGTHLAAAITDENGGYVGGDALVWTGSDGSGKVIDNATCSDWGASGVAGKNQMGAVGLAGSLSDWLKTSTTVSCQTQQHVYCLGQR